MSDRRTNAATATVGLSGVGGAAALRHEALVRAHHERSDTPIERKRVFAERQLLRHRPGRKIWLGGAALGAASIPAAATGVNGLLRPTGKSKAAKRDSSERTFVGEGLHGAREAVRGRTRTAVEGAPGRLVAGNYAGGVAVGSLAGGLTHHALRNKRIGGHSKAALAAAAAATAGTATLPLQSRLTSRASHGAYEVTPVGVRRRKQGNKRPSSKATILDSKAMGPQAFRAQTVGKSFIPGKGYVSASEAGIDALRAAAAPKSGGPGVTLSARQSYLRGRRANRKSMIEVSANHKQKRQQRRIDRGRQVSPLNRWAGDLERRTKPELDPWRSERKLTRNGYVSVPRWRLPVSGEGISDAKARQIQNWRVTKREDVGAGMSRGERRARIAASGPPIPIVGDVIQARQAARLSPEKYSRRTGAQVVGAGQVGGLAGNALGAGAALALAHKSPRFDTKARAANDWVDDKKSRGKAKVYSLANRKPSESSPMVQRAIAHRRTPQLVRTGIRRTVDSPLGRAVARNPKVAAIGALAGGAIGGPAATQAMLSHTMSRDDRYRKTMAKRAADKAAAKPIPLTQRESTQLRRRKEIGAAASMVTGSTGIAALGTTLAIPALKHGKLSRTAWAKPARKRLKKVTLPLVAVGGGVGGLNSFNYANIQRQEAHQIRKALATRHLGGYGPEPLSGLIADAKALRTSAGTSRKLRRSDVKAIRANTQVTDKQLWTGGKALGIRPPRIPGVRRAPGMRKGFLRQTRYPSGMVRTSSVRGGLA